MMYQLLRRFLFLFPAEAVHYFSMNCLRALCSMKPLRKLIRNYFRPPQDPELERHIMGLDFRNPVGLAAGFDKNARYLRELDTLGFGFVEIGTVTPLPQAGNEKPRLFRLSKDRALLNRMGFNNDGAARVAGRLKAWRQHCASSSYSNAKPILIGGNIGKNKLTSNEDAWKDYEFCFRELADHVDYFVVNVSSPNTPGLRALQEKESLRKILTNLQQINFQRIHPRPILVKIAPDLSQEQLDEIVDLVVAIKLDGLVATNTTSSREVLRPETKKLCESYGPGGISGLPLQEMSTKMIRYISEKTGAQLVLMGSGGVFTGADASEKIRAGASLIQVWTGFIYEGPDIAKSICRYLVEQKKS